MGMSQQHQNTIFFSNNKIKKKCSKFDRDDQKNVEKFDRDDQKNVEEFDRDDQKNVQNLIVTIKKMFKI